MRNQNNILQNTLEELVPKLQNCIDLMQEEIDSIEEDSDRRKQILVVRIDCGEPILRKDQSKTFGFVIEILGIENVKALGKTVGDDELISTSRPTNPNVRTYASGPYFIKTTMNVGTKKRLLEEIASELDPQVLFKWTSMRREKYK